MDDTYDVVVIGGGAAGLSGALALARFRRSVLVVDGGQPRNAPAGQVHNFLTRDGTPPAELYAAGRGEVEAYGGRVTTGQVSALTRDGEHFLLDIGGTTVTARRVLVATGSYDELPDIPGLFAEWGAGVVHCPYCHGWEVRDRRIGVLATGSMAVHHALLFRQLSEQVTVLQHTAAPFATEQAEQLAAMGIPVVPGRVVQVDPGPAGLAGVMLADGSRVELDALAVASVCRARAELLAPLGLKPREVVVADHLMGTQVDADPSGATTVPGLWVAGNVANVAAQVMTSAASALAAGVAINNDLVLADAAAARYEQRYGQRAWDERYREHGHRHVWSGEPNAVLVGEVGDLPPGTALDVGAGEGGDAVWLASRGWEVTAVDLSPVALDRGRRTAEQAGVDIDWQHTDLTIEPISGSYDLVTACYLHMPRLKRQALFTRLAAAVAPGGTLLIVGHDPSDMDTAVPRPDLAEMGWPANEVADALDADWVVDNCTAVPRRQADHEGRQVTVHDAVLRAHRAA